MNAFEALKKAHAATAITRDDSSLQDFYASHKDKDTQIAQMEITELESKFVATVKRDDGTQGGFRTRFTLSDGSTVGTFSQQARKFFEFFAGVVGYNVQNLPAYLSVKIDGAVIVGVTKINLTNGKINANAWTYNFDLISGDVNGFSENNPFEAIRGQLELGDGRTVNGSTGEIEE